MSLVLGGDSIILFTNSGMVQFKDIFIGTDTHLYKRASPMQPPSGMILQAETQKELDAFPLHYSYGCFICVLKRAHDLGRCLAHGLIGFHRWVGWA